jgi:hypothetical protein
MRRRVGSASAFSRSASASVWAGTSVDASVVAGPAQQATDELSGSVEDDAEVR